MSRLQYLACLTTVSVSFVSLHDKEYWAVHSSVISIKWQVWAHLSLLSGHMTRWGPSWWHSMWGTEKEARHVHLTFRQLNIVVSLYSPAPPYDRQASREISSGLVKFGLSARAWPKVESLTLALAVMSSSHVNLQTIPCSCDVNVHL